MTEPPDREIRFRLPAAGIRVWPDESRGDADAVLERTAGELAQLPGAYVLGPSLFAVAPAAGDPAVFDCAVSWSRRLLQRISPSSVSGHARPPAGILVFPTALSVGDGTTEMLPDPLAHGLEIEPPRLAEGGIYLTSRASKMLEHGLELAQAGQYRSPSGQMVPLVRVAAGRADDRPWRNPELMGRALPAVDRPALQAEIEEGLEVPALRVSGPLGVGKSRLLWEVLKARDAPFVWVRARPARRNLPHLGEQLLAELLAPEAAERLGAVPETETCEAIRDRLESRPGRPRRGEPEGLADLCLEALGEVEAGAGAAPVVVVDELEQLTDLDRRFLERLLEAAGDGAAPRLVLAGRSGFDPPTELARLPEVSVPPLAEQEMEMLAGRLVEGLSLPDSVRGRFLEVCAGHPFAFEEGLFGLLHERTFRRIYGSFFFGGTEETEYRPSLRLVRHLAAEASRLGDVTPILLLSLAGAALPAEELTVAAGELGGAARAGWEKVPLAAGLLRQSTSAWAEGLTLCCAAYRYALSFLIAEEDAPRARHLLGELLAARGGSGEAHWQAYLMLAGTEGAAEPLLAAVNSPWSARIPRLELLETLTREIAAHRERGGDEKIELQLIWRLLPLARRMGRLHQITDQLSRALELASDEPGRLLAIAGLKAEMEKEAGELRKAETTLRQALRAATGGPQRRQAMLLIQLGKLFLRAGKLGDAEAIFERLLEALPGSGQGALDATCRFYMGRVALRQGRVGDAFDHHKAALDERRRQGLRRQEGVSLSALGEVSLALGNYPQALKFYERARSILEEHGREDDTALALLGLSRARTRLGDYTGAARPARSALALREGRDDVGAEAIARLAVAENYLHLGQAESGLQQAREAHFQLSLLSLDEPLAEAEQLLGRLLLQQRKPEQAARALSTAHEAHQARGDQQQQACDLAWLLETGLALENDESVQRYAADLKELLVSQMHPELGEVLFFRLYRAMDWLSSRGRKVGDPTPHLERAYRLLLDKARHLAVEDRHRFLFQIPINQEIVDAAARRGMAAEGAEQ